MVKQIFSIRDAKGNIYNNPFIAINQRDAEFTFRKVVNDPQSLISQYPDDFDLYLLGEYNDSTGSILALDTPKHVQKAVVVKNSSKFETIQPN